MMQLHPTLVIFSSAFFAILFLQSGLDKVIDRKGNLESHVKQFEGTSLKNYVVLMLTMITIMEISCGFLSVAGIIIYLLNSDPRISFYADCIASINFLCLFFGLRISKDYGGAAGLVPYFIVSLVAIYFTS